MNCERCDELLVEYAHEELDAPTRAALSTHLGQCGACATAYCRLRADIHGIALAHVESPRPQVRDALRRRVAVEFARPWWRSAWGMFARPIPAYGAIGVALVPIVLWIASGLKPDLEVNAADPSADAPPTSAPRVRNYDASHTPGIYRGVL